MWLVSPLDELAEIIMLKREYISFANCGLPYHIGGVIEIVSIVSADTRKLSIDFVTSVPE